MHSPYHNINKSFQWHVKRLIKILHCGQVGFTLEMQNWFNIWKKIILPKCYDFWYQLCYKFRRSQNSLKFDNSLELLTELVEVLHWQLQFHYSKRLQIRTSWKEDARSREAPKCKASSHLLPMAPWTALHPSSYDGWEPPGHS